MRIFGIRINVQFDDARSFTDEWLERFYSSLEGNIAIVSVDLFLDESERSVGVLLGISCPEGLDEQSLVAGIAEDALDKAIDEADGAHTTTWNRESSEVLAFA